MNSSTSSSNREWRVVLFLVVCLLTAEGLIRLIEPKLSRDLAQIRNLPNVAQAMREHRGDKVLVVGNSLTRQAMDADVLADGLKSSGRESPGVFFFVADGTSIANWDYGLARYFLHPGALPDEVFIGAGPLHLRDTTGDASRLSAYYVDSADLKRAWTQDVVSWEEKGEFVLSRLSVVHASRRRIKPHVFGRLVPHYFEIEQWINTQNTAAQMRTGKVAVANETHHHLAHLLQACRESNIKVTLFSIPLPQPYETSPAALEVIKAGGAGWLPLSDIKGLAPENFPDGYHLNADGARVFTREFVKALSPVP